MAFKHKLFEFYNSFKVGKCVVDANRIGKYSENWI